MMYDMDNGEEMTADLDLQRAFVALIAAAVDGDLERAALILRRDDDPDFAFKVAMYTAWYLASGARSDPERLEEMRAETAREIYRLAQRDS